MSDILLTPANLAVITGFVALIVLAVLLIILHFWPNLYRTDGVAQAQEVNALKAKIHALEGTQSMLLEQLVATTGSNEELRRRIGTLERELHVLRAQLEEKKIIDKPIALPPLPLLLVAIGSDSQLEIDLASLRAVRTTSGMEFQRIEQATLAKLKTALDRERSAGRRANVHLAVHSGPEGVQLGGQLLDAVALSEVLQGVQILLIAGCRSDVVADFLGVVPAVVSMSDDVSMIDASIFARHFWVGIGNRLPPQDALRYALDRSPSSMGEFVTRSW